MKLISWNVNGLRACAGKGFFDFFAAEDADFFCLGETKMQPDQASFETPGYLQYWNSAEKKGYSGVAIFAKQEPLSVSYGLGIDEHDHEGRVMTTSIWLPFIPQILRMNWCALITVCSGKMTSEHMSAIWTKRNRSSSVET